MSNSATHRFSFCLDRSAFEKSIFCDQECFEVVNPKALNGFIQTKMGIKFHKKGKFKYLPYDNEGILIRKYKCNLNDGKVAVEYKMARHKWGRVQPEGCLSLSLFHRPTRHSLCQDYYVDFDMVNCQPSAVNQICLQNGILNQNFMKYCEDPKTVRYNVAKHHNLKPIYNEETCVTISPYEQAKKLFLSLSFGGSYDEWIKTYKAENEYMGEVLEMEKEIAGVMELIYKHNVDMIDDLLIGDEKWRLKTIHQRKRSIMGLWGQSVERMLQETCISSICQHIGFDLNAIVPCQDGFMLLKSELDRYAPVYENTVNIINGMQSELKRLWGFDIKWEVKPFDEPLKGGIPLMDEIIRVSLGANKSLLTIEIVKKGVRDIVDLCHKKMDRLKFCKNQWYYCRVETNLWECVKNPNLYIVRIVQDEINILISNVSDEICKITDGKIRFALETERSHLIDKHYPFISSPQFQSSAIKFLSDLLVDNKFSEKLDANKGFIAFKNGILNLRTMEFVSGLLPEHFITFTLDCDYKKKTVDRSCEVWKQFKKVLNNSDDELDYFMSIVGHAFTGESTDVKHMYFMIDGSGDSSGDNGKTFLFKIINHSMGDYVAKPKSSLLEKNNAKTHKQIVGLKGKRLVYMEEFPDKALNVDLLKELADGGAMENEIMFGTTETINIMGMFFVLSNHTPNLDANESAGYNRYKEVSFCSHFDRTGDREVVNEEKLEYIADPTLAEKLVMKYRDEVITLIIQYAMRYYKSGIPRTPIRFLKAEQKTKKANDEFLEWFEEFIEGNEEDRMAEKKIMEMSKLDQKKVRKGMGRLGYKYDKDLMGLGKDLSTGKHYKGGYALEK